MHLSLVLMTAFMKLIFLDFAIGFRLPCGLELFAVCDREERKWEGKAGLEWLFTEKFTK